MMMDLFSKTVVMFFLLTLRMKKGKSQCNHEASGLEYFPLAAFADALQEGKNVIGIEGHNAKLDSSDFTLDPQLIVGGGYTNLKRNFITKSYDITGKFSDEEELEEI